MTPAAAKGRIWDWSKELTMTSINDIADLVQILQDHPEWRNTDQKWLKKYSASVFRLC